MKKFMSIAAVATLVLSWATSSFAMVSADSSMSMDSSMMMKKDTSMMMKKQTSVSLSSMSVVSVAKKYGYNWKTDRYSLAKAAGITNYRGTAAQNLMIRKHIMAMSMANGDVMVGGAMMIKSRDIVDNAVLASNVTTVVAAVKAAGLVDTLKSAGPFTVFAPTNDAFAKLPAGTVETLVKPENKATLTDILTYHVVSGRYTTAQLKSGMTLTTVQGKKLVFGEKNGRLTINGSAMIETPNVISSNGVTHVIDAVLMSPMEEEGVMVGGAMMIKSRDIVDNAVLASNVTTVVAAVKAAGLVDTLKSAGPFTVFAPTNDAFAKLPAGTVETLVKPENKATLTDILTYHVVSGRYKSSDLTDGLVLTTVGGKTLAFTRVNGKLMINGSVMVETADVISSNGVTHVIDAVLMPR